MASSSSLLSEEQFQCSICLDVFTDPVFTPCGHNFCKACIGEYWDSCDLCQCPMCKEKFHRRPELRVNTFISEMSDLFRKSVQVKASSTTEQLTAKPGEVPCEVCTEPGEVPCDICTGTKLKALKSCLLCLTSYCETHLEPHHRVSALKKHKLIDPVENLEDRICKKHERPLELFCRRDQTCVCQFCTETDHKGHNTVPIEAACREKKSQLGRTQTQVQQMIQERLNKVEEIKQSVELSMKSTEKEIEASVEVFTALMRSIERSQAELLEVMEEKQKAAERKAEGIITELEQEITELKRRNAELEQLSLTEDHLHLLQIDPSLCSPPHTRHWADININTHLGVGTLMRAVTKIEETFQNEQKKLCETELKRAQQWAVDVTLDPNTAHPNLILSNDGKQVSVGDVQQKRHDNPNRFNCCPCVLGKEGFSSGRFYYEVQVKGKTVWDIGVARESVNRNVNIPDSPENGYWTVGLRKWNQYQANDTISVSLSLKPKPQKVGVFVDYEEGLVSFYNVDARSHIYSFTGLSFTEKLHPYFYTLGNDGGKKYSLIISPVNQTE